MPRIIEIRSYNLKPDMRADFERIARMEVRPMLERHGTDVVAMRTSLADDNSFCLVRAYENIAGRDSSQAAFYGGSAWKVGPRESILACIENYSTTVMEAEEATIDGLRDQPSLAQRTLINANAAANSTDGARDFDFYMGHWHIQNRRLVKRLAGSTEWESFEAIAHARPLPGGIGNYDDFNAEKWRPGFVGMSFRVYSPVTQKWTIYWLDNKTGGLEANGQLTVGVVGEFKDGIGTFTCEDQFEGKPIIVRYVWSNITATSARWEQAFSPDGGNTWETNWIMEQTRVPATAS